MISIFWDEVKHYIKNTKELFKIYSLFVSVVLLYFFSHDVHNIKDQWFISSMLWIALTVSTSLGSATLFQRDYDSGRLGYYYLAQGGLSGVIFAKWMAYYLFITIPLALVLPVLALLVDIPVGAWPHYLIGLGSGAMALSLLTSLLSAVLTGLEKAGALVAVVMLPLSIPIIIFGTSYLAHDAALFEPQLLFIWGFSLIMLPILGIAGSSCIRSSF